MRLRSSVLRVGATALALLFQVHPPARGDSFSSLAQAVEEYERTEQELARLQSQQSQARDPKQRRRLNEEIRILKQRQDELARILEQWVGPPPPAVSAEEPTLLERRWETEQNRTDATLNRRVDSNRP